MTYNYPESNTLSHVPTGPFLSQSFVSPNYSYDFMNTCGVELPEFVKASIAPNASCSQGPTPLGKNYRVTRLDVVCGRGRANCNRSGNKRFREIVKGYVKKYLSATCKMEKAAVLSSIVEQVQSPDSPGSKRGRFVKQVEDGSWWELSDTASREKSGHAIREAVSLHGKEEIASRRRSSMNKCCTRSQKRQKKEEKDSLSVSTDPSLKETLEEAELPKNLQDHPIKFIAFKDTTSWDQEADTIELDEGDDLEGHCIFGRMVASLPPPSPSPGFECDNLSFSCWSM